MNIRPAVLKSRWRPEHKTEISKVSFSKMQNFLPLAMKWSYQTHESLGDPHSWKRRQMKLLSFQMIQVLKRKEREHQPFLESCQTYATSGDVCLKVRKKTVNHHLLLFFLLLLQLMAGKRRYKERLRNSNLCRKKLSKYLYVIRFLH